MNSRCRHVWRYSAAAVLATFVYLEDRGYRTRCHPTLSRELAAWSKLLGEHGPWVFALGGAALSYHLVHLKDLPEPACASS